MTSDSILIFIVTYNAEKHIKHVLSRIPQRLLSQYPIDILIIDDHSEDQTTLAVKKFAQENPSYRISCIVNHTNLGYGGNQKLGYQHAIQQGYSVVALLHGDGQYAPEFLEAMILPILSKKADVVLGSRMINKWAALQGNMPFYKWLGNITLTILQNAILRTSFAEFHTGYRAYDVASLKRIPLKCNSDYFDFDTEIIIQFLDTKQRFVEISIPTFYGDEVSYVNGLKYALLILWTTVKSRLVSAGFLKDPRFEYSSEQGSSI